VSERAFAESRPSRPEGADEVALTDIGEKEEGALPDIAEMDERQPTDLREGPSVALAGSPREEATTVTISDPGGEDLTIQLAGAKMRDAKKKKGFGKLLKKVFEGLAESEAGKDTEFVG